MAATRRLYIFECVIFSVCIKYGAGNLVKDKGCLCLLTIPCILDEGRLVDKEIFCFLLNFLSRTKRNIPCCMRDEEKYGI